MTRSQKKVRKIIIRNKNKEVSDLYDKNKVTEEDLQSYFENLHNPGRPGVRNLQNTGKDNTVNKQLKYGGERLVTE